MAENNITLLTDKLRDAFNRQQPVKLVISKKRKKSSQIERIRITLIKISSGMKLSFTSQYPAREMTANVGIDEGIVEIRRLLAEDFFNADLFTATETFQLIQNKKGNSAVRLSGTPQTTNAATLEHDHLKNTWIETAGNIYLRELGITSADGSLIKDKTAKFRQINKYIEVLDAELKNMILPNQAIIMDMGSGKGYLTFALYDYLVNTRKESIVMTGIEYRKDLVDLCNTIAAACNYEGLQFAEGSIGSVKAGHIDVLIALHACDTATDEAIWKGITSGASLIVCAPCCHKQIRKQMQPENEMAPLMRHGILKERQAELITDGIRSLILEDHGYKTKVFEFISTEHTPKNLMITGVKKSNPGAGKAAAMAIQQLKKSYGITYHHLETLLGKNY